MSQTSNQATSDNKGKMIPVILSGGAGTRLWPLSRASYPKQFLALHSEKTLFQETVQRLPQDICAAPLVICNQEHRFIVAENLRHIGRAAQSIILEPVGRSTAPAIALAAHAATKERDDDPVLVVLHSDHVIENEAVFIAALGQARALAEEGMIVALGIQPTEPHTGYGYIERGADINADAHKIAAFKEKPDRATAEKFLSSGKYVWNAGMFVFKASTYLKELEKFSPDIVRHTKEAVEGAQTDLDFLRVAEDDFKKCEDIAIDYAVMEKTDLGAVVSLDAGWCDIGSWDALWTILPKDEDGNVCQGDILTTDSHNNYINAQNKMVATVGVNDLVIVETKDAIMVADRKKAGDVKAIVNRLKAEGRSEAQHQRVVYRPWGHYDSIDMGERDQVKRITVKPGARLSTQLHHHRAEHWVVVKGTGKVVRDEETLMLSENESVYLPIGAVHSLENPGKIPLEMIEVQVGSYLGEDDIIRFDDIYGRVPKKG